MYLARREMPYLSGARCLDIGGVFFWLRLGCRVANNLPRSAVSCLLTRQCLYGFLVFPSRRQVTSNPQVAGSIPAGRTTQIKLLQRVLSCLTSSDHQSAMSLF